MNQLTPEQLQALLGYAAKKIGMTPDQLVNTVQNGGLSALSGRAGTENMQKISQLAGNPEQLQKLLGSAEVQKFLSKLTEGGKPDGR